MKILPYKSVNIVFGSWNVYLGFGLCSKQNVFCKEKSKKDYLFFNDLFNSMYKHICIHVEHWLYIHNWNVYMPILGSIKQFSIIGQLSMYH